MREIASSSARFGISATAILPPPSVRELEIHPETGAVALAGCPKRVTELFLRGTEPTRLCTRQGASIEPSHLPGDGRPRDQRRPRRERGFWARIFGR